MKGSLQSLDPTLTSGDAKGQSLFERSYRAFISYSHTDTAWANWLIRRLEGYRVPERFQGRPAPIGEVGARIAPVFRDRDELPTADDLGEAVQDALRRSATLIIICSPAAAHSRWVNEEIMVFKRLGRGDRVYALIVEGEPNAKDPAQECFPPALRFGVGADGALSDKPVELIAADAREHADGKEDAFIRLVAGLLGVGFDDLRQREHARRMRRMMWITAGSVAGMALTAGLATFAWIRSNDAKRRLEGQEQLMTQLLDGLDARIKKADRLEELDGEIASAMAYFRSLAPRDLTDAMLTKQAKALTQIGQIRLAQARYPEAASAFATAYERAAALARRYPGDGAALFERGQAEYWIGYVHRRQGEVPDTRLWFERYLASARALVAFDPSKAEWQSELAWGLHNVAVADVDDGKLSEARRGFLAELAALMKMRQTAVAGAALQAREVDASSWLGKIAERSGDLGEAEVRYSEMVMRLEMIVRDEPGTPKWRARLADAFALHASALAIIGQRAQALERRTRGRSVLDALVAGDPQNQGWQMWSQFFRLKEARLLCAEGETEAAAGMIEETRTRLEQLAAQVPADQELAWRLVAARRLHAELLQATGRPGAQAAVVAAVELGETLGRQPHASDEVLGETAMALLDLGRFVESHDRPSALRHWQRARELLEARLPTSNHWRILDPAARACRLLGEEERKRTLIACLQKMGYQPLEPWP